MLTLLKNQIVPFLSGELGLDEKFVFDLFERPKNIDHGHLALPCFQIAKQQKTNPMELSKNLEKVVQHKILSIKNVVAMGGFLNFVFQDKFLQEALMKALESPEKMGFQIQKNPQTVVIDYVSPNVAKPMHVGHFRAALIGQSIRNLAFSQGYDVVGVNHLGDWGTQFGKLIWTLQNWEPGFDWESEGVIDRLLALYVRFHDEAKTNPQLETAGAEVFKKLEQGDSAIQLLWQQVVDASMKEYERLFALLRIQHDKVLGEAFYSDKLPDVIQRLEKAELLKDSQGAKVVFFDEAEKLPPCLIQKSDGASIYATRDLATAIYRKEVMGADQLLYVVGQDQALHFRQVFRVLSLLGYDWAKDCHHIPFGLYRFKEGKMSTRQGRVIVFEDLINKAIELAKALIEEKNPALENKDQVALQVAVGALTFGDLMNDRMKDVEFDWGKMLSFEGDTGPFVQYTAVRCRSVLKKYGKPIPKKFHEHLILSKAESQLIYRILLIEDVLKISYQQFKPNVLAQYLLDLCSDFSQFYRDCRVLGEEATLEENRILLVQSAFFALKQGLGVLNIEVPEAM